VPPPATRTVVFAVGDGADGSATSAALANYIKAQKPDRFFYLGDVYESGTATEFANNYEPLYGSMAGVTDPVIGNHEDGNRSTGYYPYWRSKRGWTAEQAKHRSYVDAASGWQVIAYSSEENMAAEGAWVGGEVAKHPGTCRIVMAHKGRHIVVDSAHGDNPGQETVWSAIRNKTAINLVAHNHVYGRLEPIDGVTVIVSGAGGQGLRSLGSQHHAVAASKTGVATATRLVLRRGAADFTQVDSNGTIYDSGTITCTPV
jgi:Calcineurin-like phosphoesterase